MSCTHVAFGFSNWAVIVTSKLLRHSKLGRQGALHVDSNRPTCQQLRVDAHLWQALGAAQHLQGGHGRCKQLWQGLEVCKHISSPADHTQGSQKQAASACICGKVAVIRWRLEDLNQAEGRN